MTCGWRITCPSPKFDPAKNFWFSPGVEPTLGPCVTFSSYYFRASCPRPGPGRRCSWRTRPCVISWRWPCEAVGGRGWKHAALWVLLGFAAGGMAWLRSSAVFVVLGGVNNLWGPILGAVIITLVPEVAREFGSGFAEVRQLFFFGVLVVLLLFRSQGVLGFRSVSVKSTQVSAATRRALAKAHSDGDD